MSGAVAGAAAVVVALSARQEDPVKVGDLVRYAGVVWIVTNNTPLTLRAATFDERDGKPVLDI